MVTNRRGDTARLLDFCEARCQHEDMIKELKFDLKADRLSCPRFAANVSRLLLAALAYQLLVLFRRLGPEPLQLLYERIVAPIAAKSTRGAWYRGWRLVSLDGTTVAVADTAENEQAFGRPGQSRDKAAQPLVRLVSLEEHAPALRQTTVRRVVSQSHLTLREGPPQ